MFPYVKIATQPKGISENAGRKYLDTGSLGKNLGPRSMRMGSGKSLRMRNVIVLTLCLK